MNTINIIGNLTRDTELKYTPTGKAVATFTLAVPDRFNKEKTDFIDCVIWNKLAELCAEYLKKGNKAGVAGRLSTRTYKNKEDRSVKVAEIIADDVTFLTPKNESRSTARESFEDMGRMQDEEEIPW